MTSMGRRCGSRRRISRCRPPTSSRTSRCRRSSASSTACTARCRGNGGRHAAANSVRSLSPPELGLARVRHSLNDRSRIYPTSVGRGLECGGSPPSIVLAPHPTPLPARVGRGSRPSPRCRQSSNHRKRPMYENLLADVPTDLWIGGKWRKASNGGRFDVIDPATENKIASGASATVEDAKAAVDAASEAVTGSAAKKPRERAEILRKSFDMIMRDAERLAKLITIENGKALSDSRGEVAYAAEFFRWYAEEAVRAIGALSRAPASGARIVVQHKPAGVAVLVTPWNFPAAMATRKIGPALAAGCPVVLKPASDPPLTMLALMPILEEAGVPAGVVNVIPSRSSGKVVSAMLHDPRVRVVSFTGSTEVGRKLLHEAADNVVKPAMELGGNAPFIVFEDADIDAAIDGAMI